MTFSCLRVYRVKTVIMMLGKRWKVVSQDNKRFVGGRWVYPTVMVCLDKPEEAA